MSWGSKMISMEHQLPTLNLMFNTIIIVFLFIVVLKIIQKIMNPKRPKLPPGPWRLPLIGNLHQMIIGSVSRLPHHFLKELAKKHGPLMHLQLGQVSTIVVSSPEIAREIYKTNDAIFSHRPNLLPFKIFSYDNNGIVTAPYGRYWRNIRKIGTIELLSAKRVQSFRSIREEEVSNLIKTIQSNISSGNEYVVNLSEKIYVIFNDITCKAMFGDKCKEQQAFKAAIMEFVPFALGFNIADFYPYEVLQVITGMRSKLEKLHQVTDKILQDTLNDHRDKKVKIETNQQLGEEVVNDREDLVDVFLKLQQDCDLELSLTDNNIKAIIWELFSAGSETSASVVDWAMVEMLKNPKVMKKTQDEVRRVFNSKGNVDETDIHELKFLKLVIKETLRLHPPGPLLAPRESRESCVINGYDIPKKTRVMVNAWAIGRDPMYWSEADRFYPERFLDSSIDFDGTNFELIPFGAGRRMCPGISFATATMEMLLAQLLYHFDWKLPNSGMKQEDLDMTESFGISIRRKEDLLLIPIPYHPVSITEKQS